MDKEPIYISSQEPPTISKNNPELPTSAKKTSTLYTKTKIRDPPNYASLSSHSPISISHALKDPKLTDKDLMKICAQGTPMSVDDKLDLSTATKMTPTPQPNKKIRNPYRITPMDPALATSNQPPIKEPKQPEGVNIYVYSPLGSQLNRGRVG